LSAFGDKKRKMYKFSINSTIMRKDNSKERKIEKHKKSHQTLDSFYSPEQKQHEQKKETEAKHRKSVTDTEMEIFEHLKNHTKKILKKS